MRLKKLFLALLFVALNAADSPQFGESTNTESAQNILNLPHENAPDSHKSQDSFFSSAKVSKSHYGGISVGYEVLYRRASEPSAAGKITRHSSLGGIFFALERGFIVADDVLLLGFSLDGSTLHLYSLNLNAKIAARLLSGRIVPSLGVGYGLLQHYDVNKAQHNLHGTSATAAVFVDVTHGFGLEVGYRVGLHKWRTTRKSSLNAAVRGAFMLNLKFMDF